MSEDWKPDARTVRACIEALPGETRYTNGGRVIDECAAALEALLPDPAEELVREWVEQLGSVLFDAIDECALNFARWLIETDRIKPSEIGK